MQESQIQVEVNSTQMKKLTSSIISPYFSPAQTQSSICCGKPPFKSRFDIVIQGQRCICQKCCSFCCFFIKNPIKNFPRNGEDVQQFLPIIKPVFTSAPDKLTYTWIGHSTAVISIGQGTNIMIDPVFSLRSSPVQWAGPKRYRPPACNIEELPPIHGVFISHDHYDHLDQYTLNSLQQQHKPVFCAGLESSDCFPVGCKLHEFDWTQTKKIQINKQIFQVTFFPVAHWSKRHLCYRNTRLWGGFVIKTPKGKKIFYPGDTAYCQIFKEIGQRFGPFDLAIIPIGAYQPRHLLRFSHVNPDQSVMIHKEIYSKKSVGVHWGTFPLGFEHWYQPKQDLQAAKIKHGLEKDEFVTIGHGQYLQIDY